MLHLEWTESELYYTLIISLMQICEQEEMLQSESSIIYLHMKRSGDCITMAMSHRVNIHTTVDYGGKII